MAQEIDFQDHIQHNPNPPPGGFFLNVIKSFDIQNSVLQILFSKLHPKFEKESKNFIKKINSTKHFFLYLLQWEFFYEKLGILNIKRVKGIEPISLGFEDRYSTSRFQKNFYWIQRSNLSDANGYSQPIVE